MGIIVIITVFSANLAAPFLLSSIYLFLSGRILRGISIFLFSILIRASVTFGFLDVA
jgi:hypothetical protein